MTEFFSRFSGGELIGLFAVGGGLLFAAISVIATQWSRVRVTESESVLKQLMLDKGMSAAEIEQVMKAGQASSSAQTISSTGIEALDKAALAQRMVDNGYEGQDIERVLKAYQPDAKKADEKALVNQA